MNAKSRRFLNRYAGVTLIELLGALALMATLLASILVAKADAVRQYFGADRRLEAARAADDLLTRWWGTRDTRNTSKSNSPSFPRDDTGQLRDRDLAWRTQSVSNEQIESLGAQVISLEILDAREGSSQTPLIYVEVVLPKPEPARAEAQEVTADE